MPALLMVTYNNSITKMNKNWEPMDFKTALVLSLFMIFSGAFFGTLVRITDSKTVYLERGVYKGW